VLPLRTIRLITVSVILSACHNPHAGFTRYEGIYYQLLKLGDTDKSCQAGNYITADIRYMTMGDSVFFSGVRKFRVGQPDFPGSVHHCFLRMKEQDSAVFVIPANDFFQKTLHTHVPSYLHDAREMKMAVFLSAIQTEEEYQTEKELFLRWQNDFNEHEKALMQDYLRDAEITVPSIDDGVYYLRQREGTGAKVQTGKTVTVQYEGYFLDGKKFDSTVEQGEPFKFVFGQENQVIRGLAKVISQMQSGESGTAVIASGEAFGHNGSSTGIIPPFTTVVYKIEVLEVR
jgi:FKBP-type peptidyl-prolyl cis-trans isomerase